MIALLLSSPLQSFARWPNAALTLFLLSGLAQIAAVQATMWTRRYDTSPPELAAWYPEEVVDGTPSAWLRSTQIGHSELNERWADRTRLVYHCGIVLLLSGLVTIIVPTGHITAPRWILIVTAVAGLAGEILWIVAASSFDPDRRRTSLYRTALVLLWAVALAVAATADSVDARLLVLAPACVLVVVYLAQGLLEVVRGSNLRTTILSVSVAVVSAAVAVQFVLAVAAWSAWALALTAVVFGGGEAGRVVVALRSRVDGSGVAVPRE
jgi:hypothetical protein